MTEKERFKIYSKLLRIYFWNWIFQDTSYFATTGRGFCWALRNMPFKESATTNPIIYFPELLAMKPKSSKYGSYWYKRGAVTPRLWCLIRLFTKHYVSKLLTFWKY